MCFRKEGVNCCVRHLPGAGTCRGAGAAAIVKRLDKRATESTAVLGVLVVIRCEHNTKQHPFLIHAGGVYTDCVFFGEAPVMGRSP
jgi:hypothetical protein